MSSTDVTTLTALRNLRSSIADEAARRMDRWQSEIETPSFAASAANLAQYLAFRHHDLRSLQRELMRHGLSSLGRLESRVMITLDTVEACLAAVLSGPPATNWPAAADEFFHGGLQVPGCPLLQKAGGLLSSFEPHGGRLSQPGQSG